MSSQRINDIIRADLGGTTNMEIYDMVKQISKINFIPGSGVKIQQVQNNAFLISADVSEVTPATPNVSVTTVGTDSEIGVAPVILNSITTALVITPNYYPSSTVVQSYTLSITGTDIGAAIVGGNGNVYITTPAPDEVAINVPNLVGNADIIVTNVSSGGNVVAYDLSLGPNVVNSTTSTAPTLVNSTIAANTLTITPNPNLVTGTSSTLPAVVNATETSNQIVITPSSTLVNSATSTNTNAVGVSIANNALTVSPNANTVTSVSVAAGTPVNASIGSGGVLDLSPASNFVSSVTSTSSPNLTTTPTTGAVSITLGPNVVTSVSGSSPVPATISSGAISIGPVPGVITSVTSSSAPNLTATTSSGATTIALGPNVVTSISGTSPVPATISSGALSIGPVAGLGGPIPTNTFFVSPSWTNPINDVTFTSIASAETYAATLTTPSTIIVYPGTYNETQSPLLLNTGIDIIGVDEGNITITGNIIQLNLTTISANITLKNLNFSPADFFIESNTSIGNVVFQNVTWTGFGIFSVGPTSGTILFDNCYISSNGVASDVIIDGGATVTINNSTIINPGSGTSEIATILRMNNATIKAGDTSAAPMTFSGTGQIIRDSAINGYVSITGFMNIFSSSFAPTPTITWNGTGCMWDCEYLEEQLTTTNAASATCDRNQTRVFMAVNTTTASYNVPFSLALQSLTGISALNGIPESPSSLTQVNSTSITYSSSATEARSTLILCSSPALASIVVI